MDRMSAQDVMFLDWEQPNSPLHVGAVYVMEGPPPSFQELREAMVAKLPLVPRYRQKVQMVPLSLHRPVWIEAPEFDIDYHIRQTALPAPGSKKLLEQMAGRIMSHHLERDRPLWECYFVEAIIIDYQVRFKTQKI